MNPFPTFWHNFQISNMPSFWDIHVLYPVTTMYFVCFFMILYSIRHFWLGSRCIQEKSFTIQERWILSQHSDTIFRSPTYLASEIYTFVSCHHDVFCVFFHDIVLDSSFLTGFTLYTRKILPYTWKMNPFQHSDTIFRSSTSPASEIYTFVFSEARNVGDLKIVSECWERIHLSCIVKDFSCIQREPSQKWRIEYNIMKKHTKYIVVTGYKRVYLRS